MQTPEFWRRDPPALRARLLRPIGALYGAITSARMRRDGGRATLPVICIGNFTAGGAGKTPTALAIARMLMEMGERPAFLTRGHKGRLAGPVVVDPARHDFPDVGDEPLLLAQAAPTVLSRDRPAGARLCARLGASVVVMDDGLQNPSLRKDLRLVVVDGGAGVSNGLCLPAGPLRAPLEAQWPFVDALVVMGEGAAGEALADEARARGKPVFAARLVPDPEVASSLASERVLAFAGIGRPEKFFATLEQCGAQIVEREAFPDHHPFTAGEIGKLRERAARQGLRLVTSCKDLVRIAEPGDIAALPVDAVFSGEEALRTVLAQALAIRRASGS
jgi:tetraacyldisaccharide 4'-kinase